LKFTGPGVPDVYEGNEIWDYSLVDPDNRRPVDYDLRRKMLCDLKGTTAEELLRSWADGRIKLFVTQRLLHLRREHPDFFRQGNYVPLQTIGAFADCAVAYMREYAGHFLLVVATRLSSRLGFPATGERWKDTAVKLPESLPVDKLNELFTARQMQASERSLNVADAMDVLPFAAFTNLL
jgi:(1->4)-alpha-D-glucan 1-alpha-D-glucosylmutase